MVLVGQGRFHVAIAALLVVVLVFLPVQRSGRALWWAPCWGCSMAALVVLPQWWSQILLLGLGRLPARGDTARIGRSAAGQVEGDVPGGRARVEQTPTCWPG